MTTGTEAVSTAASLMEGCNLDPNGRYLKGMADLIYSAFPGMGSVEEVRDDIIYQAGGTCPTCGRKGT